MTSATEPPETLPTADLPAGCEGRMRQESAVVSALALRYAAPAYAFLPSVRNATGWQRTARTADALAMSLWPSRGLELHGFEVKVSRSDWLRELKDPAKADEIASRCDRWWIAAGDKSIVQPGELPPTWGLLVPHGPKAMRVAVEAPKNEKPVDLSRAFLAAILRRVAESQPGEVEIAARVATATESIQAEWAKVRAEERTARRAEAEKDLESLRKVVSDFEKASGVQVDRWNANNIGAAVRLVVEGRADDKRRALEEVARDAERIAASAREILKIDTAGRRTA